MKYHFIPTNKIYCSIQVNGMQNIIKHTLNLCFDECFHMPFITSHMRKKCHKHNERRQKLAKSFPEILDNRRGGPSRAMKTSVNPTV